jgi:hypothetical protein
VSSRSPFRLLYLIFIRFCAGWSWLVLRHEVAVLHRTQPRPRPDWADRPSCPRVPRHLRMHRLVTSGTILRWRKKVRAGEDGHGRRRPGMITSARVQALSQREDGTQRPDAYGWITELRAPAIKKLMADDGPLQLSVFDQQDIAEITY